MVAEGGEEVVGGDAIAGVGAGAADGVLDEVRVVFALGAIPIGGGTGEVVVIADGNDELRVLRGDLGGDGGLIGIVDAVIPDDSETNGGGGEQGGAEGEE